MYPKLIKRVIDFCLAFVMLVLLSPLLLPLILIQLFVYKGKVFFFQARPGKDESRFEVIKFKTMTDEKDENGALLPNHTRMTSIGRFLRAYSIDELPQLINVLKGEMSLIGPRPLLFKYLPLYSEEQKRRHLVRPGITGLAQVNGRNSISWDEKFEFDQFYVDHISFLLDIKILWLTFIKVVKSEGVDAGKELTMPPFNGHN